MDLPKVHPERIAGCPAPDLQQPATKTSPTIGGNNTHIVSSSWWWAQMPETCWAYYKCNKPFSGIYLLFLLYAYATMHGQTHIKFIYQHVAQMLEDAEKYNLTVYCSTTIRGDVSKDTSHILKISTLSQATGRRKCSTELERFCTEIQNSCLAYRSENLDCREPATLSVCCCHHYHLYLRHY